MDNLKGMEFALDARIVFWSRRGGGISYLEETLVSIKSDQSRNHNTDIIVTFIGGNDLDSPFVAVKTLVRRFYLAINEVARVAGSVAVLKQWPRPGARQGINYWVNAEYFDYLLHDQLVMQCFTWSWDRSMKFNE